MATITITLGDAPLSRLERAAELLGALPEDLVRACFAEFLEQTDAELDTIITEILAERGEVLRRLAR